MQNLLVSYLYRCGERELSRGAGAGGTCRHCTQQCTLVFYHTFLVAAHERPTSGAAPSRGGCLATCSKCMADAIARVRDELLDGPLRVTLLDGRVLVGRFTCFDKQRNVLLTEAREQRDVLAGSHSSERHLGLVLVPWRWIASCHAATAS